MSVHNVYFDNNATTPLDSRVRDAMIEWLGCGFGNPSSVHRYGQRARGVVEAARVRVAHLLGGEPSEIVFCASGTEANNAVLAMIGRRARRGGGGRHVVISAIEHPSIVQAARRLEAEEGFEVSEIAPGADGVVRVEDVIAALRPDTALVALMLANNELGTLQPVAELARACRERGVPVLCDAVQAAGKVAVRVAELGVDSLVIAAHKFHGPLGAAALWVRSGTAFEPLLVGGGQERRRRASTENAPALLGFGLGCELAAGELEERGRRLLALRERLERGLLDVPGAIVRCRTAPRLPNTSCVTFSGVDATTLLMRLDLEGFAVSTGAACASGTVEPSRTLRALGLEEDEALSTLRVSFGLGNTGEEVDAFLPVLSRAVTALRAGAPRETAQGTMRGGRR
ncbi:MAG TPA: cysteine desulfurase family protein [Thermoanaerobaculia bacterium]|nr:cysteine desulfurase family protein [Thermoanaerobaculia bacterium]